MARNWEGQTGEQELFSIGSKPRPEDDEDPMNRFDDREVADLMPVDLKGRGDDGDVRRRARVHHSTDRKQP